jgi:hypothetical protein
MEGIRFWIEEGSSEMLRTTRKYNQSLQLEHLPQFDGYFVGYMQDKNELGARTSKTDFVRGEILPWDEIRDHRCLHVLVEENPLTTGFPAFVQV